MRVRFENGREAEVREEIGERMAAKKQCTVVRAGPAPEPEPEPEPDAVPEGHHARPAGPKPRNPPKPQRRKE